MSRLLWKNLLIPDMQVPATTLVDDVYGETLENVRQIALSNEQITIPEAKAFRSMSRSSLLLSHICMEAQPLFDQAMQTSPFNLGVYCATENGPIDGPTTAKILQNSDKDFSEIYRKLRNPKMYLKQLPNLIPAQLGIFMGMQGPLNVYTHAGMGSVHALEQAEHDLQNGLVEYALVCTTSAFDDYLVVKRNKQMDPRCLSEGVGAMLLQADQTWTPWFDMIKSDKNNYFGISDAIINLIRGDIVC